jgi:hypothetical protein
MLRPEILMFYTKAWMGCEADIESIAEEALDIYAGEPDMLQIVNEWIAQMKELGLL